MFRSKEIKCSIKQTSFMSRNNKQPSVYSKLKTDHKTSANSVILCGK